MEECVPFWLLEVLSDTFSVGRRLKAQKQGMVQHDFHSANPLGHRGQVSVRGSMDCSWDFFFENEARQPMTACK